MKNLFYCRFILLITACWPFVVSAQITAFVYQGRLNDGGTPANGIYDFRFAVYDSTNESSTSLAETITNSAVSVSNGLFIASLDFGPGVFSGAYRWLEVAVRTNGSDSFVKMIPRQEILPTPYAIYANTASNLIGTLSATQLNGDIPLAQLPTMVVTNGASNVNISGTFSGNGAGITNLNVSVIDENSSITNYDWLKIICWGDSLTYGSFGMTIPYNYPYELGFDLNRVAINRGVSGDTSSQIAARMLDATTNYSWTTVIWAGRNDFTDTNTVLTNIANMVKACLSVGNTHYVVLSIINGTGEPVGTADYNTITNLNGILAAAYPKHYLDIRTLLVNAANTNEYPTDITNLIKDLPAYHFCSTNSPHLNGPGYGFVGDQVASFISSKLDDNVLLPLTSIPSLFGQIPEGYDGHSTLGVYGSSPFTIGALYFSSRVYLHLTGDLDSLGISSSLIPDYAIYTLGTSRFPWSALFLKNYAYIPTNIAPFNYSNPVGTTTITNMNDGRVWWTPTFLVVYATHGAPAIKITVADLMATNTYYYSPFPAGLTLSATSRTTNTFSPISMSPNATAVITDISSGPGTSVAILSNIFTIE